MPKENLKQVAVRMHPSDHRAAIKMAKRERMTFGEFVRQAVNDKVEILKKWQPVGKS